jgi:outer membrane protein OmpA-like peptidoglycan-associated protein
MIFYRGDGNEDMVTKVRVNDRVVGSLLPNRFAQTRACKGTADIEIISVVNGEQKSRYSTSATIPGLESLYFKVVEAGDGRFSLQQRDEVSAKKELSAIKSISHIINRNNPDCTQAPTVVPVEKPVPVVLQRINLMADELFGFNGSQSGDMLPKRRISMDNLTRELRSSNLKLEKLRIGWHTDLIGSETYNQKLLEQRA